jgi:hypothetical protein
MTIPRKSFFKIETGRNIDEVQEMLEKKVAKQQSLITLLFPLNPFVGEIYSEGFDIRQAVCYGRTFLPVFHGAFEETEKGVVVRIEAYNGFATVNVLAGWLATLVTIIAAFVNLLHANYSSAVILFWVSIVCAASAVFIGWLYNQKMNDGRKELVSMWTTKTQRR